MIFLHGKIFNREFLTKHNIRFRPGLRTFEDTFFCKTCTLAAKPKTALTLDTYAYVWKRADGSISSSWNHDGRSYMYWRVDDYIGCNEGALDFFREHYKENPIDRMPELIYHTLVYTYLNIHTTDFVGDDEQTVEKRNKLLEMSRRIVINNKEFLSDITDELKQNLHKECLQQISSVRATVSEFRPTFNDFLKNTLKLSKEYRRYLKCDYKPEPEKPAETVQESPVAQQNK